MASKELSMSYTINTGSKWFYCNYPEQFIEKHMAKENKCFNQAEVPSGTGQIFYSYNSKNIPKDFRFGIQIYNPNSTSITFKRENYGHANQKESGGWFAMAKNSWVRFFQGNAATYTIASGKSAWICDEAIPCGYLFSGNLRYHTSAKAIITAYAYYSKSEITGTATPVNFVYGDRIMNGAVYSGVGNGYFLTAAKQKIDISDNTVGDSVHFYTNHTPDDRQKRKEVIPIKLAGTGNYTAPHPMEDDEFLNNLCNWCAQYYIQLSFTNNLSKARKIKCAIKNPTHAVKYPIIVYNGNVGSANLPNIDDTYEWATITIPSRTTVDVVYQSILGTNSYTLLDHVFTITQWNKKLHKY